MSNEKGRKTLNAQFRESRPADLPRILETADKKVIDNAGTFAAENIKNVPELPAGEARDAAISDWGQTIQDALDKKNEK
jgi:hypothetical protein